MNKKLCNKVFDDNNTVIQVSAPDRIAKVNVDNKSICGEKSVFGEISQEKIEQANKIIQDNSHLICDAANSFAVSPVDVAMVVYAEQCFNAGLKEENVDKFVMPTSDVPLGLGKMRISTAKMIEDSGYMPITQFADWRGNNYVENREYGIALKLLDAKTNIKYVAAYLSLIIDSWQMKYPSIRSNHLVLAMLYNNGAYGTDDLQKNSIFGKFASNKREFLNQLLG